MRISFITLSSPAIIRVSVQLEQIITRNTRNNIFDTSEDNDNFSITFPDVALPACPALQLTSIISCAFVWPRTLAAIKCSGHINQAVRLYDGAPRLHPETAGLCFSGHPSSRGRPTAPVVSIPSVLRSERHTRVSARFVRPAGMRSASAVRGCRRFAATGRAAPLDSRRSWRGSSCRLIKGDKR